jgi:FG-GAP-like repeat/FG-GAP repeat
VNARWIGAGAALLAMAGSQSAQAQGLLQFLQDPDPDVALGGSVTGIGDVDHDGTPDYAIAATRVSTQLPSVRVISGRHGALLYEIPPFLPHFFLPGMILAGVGDVNGDGTPDLAIGDTTAQLNGMDLGAVSLHSGVDGALLRIFWGTKVTDEFGCDVEAAGDVDGDGRPDVIVGAMQYAPMGTDPGYANVYSGATGQLLHHWTGTSHGGGFGGTVCGAGDIDGDGHADLAVGAVLASVSSVWVFSGSDGSTLHVLDAGAAAWCVAGGSDLDGDGVPDIAAGAGNWVAPAGPDAGRISAWSGANWNLIFSQEGTAKSQFFGSVVDMIDDVDGDGLSDLLVGAYVDPPAIRNEGAVYLIPGRGGAALWSIVGAPLQFLGNQSNRLAPLGDLDGDGYPEFAAAALATDIVEDDGSVRVHSTTLLPPSTYGTAKVNSLGCTPTLTWSGTPSLSGAGDFVLRCSEVLNQSPGVALWSEFPALIPFNGGLLCLGTPRFVLARMRSGGSSTGTDCTGVLMCPLRHGALAAHGMTAGMTICVQFGYRDHPHPDGTGVGLSGGVIFSVFP